ncbi:hypothetical protein L3X38_041025 [Prunus dulcis]|uniref:Reverse transcriptase zinc-binding domain-containing protein n=1 Tax=Prunus dulcis TaxID=3755 RepID=A0AAD4UU62_PRUDU|nr:hypothetical protein L3X38_041025 [Prunus dulcis]
MLLWTMRDFMTDHGWDLDALEQVLPNEIAQRICAIHTGFESQRNDKCIWGLSNNGSFYVKSAYLSFFDDADIVPWPWEFIWKLCLPQKLKTFVWLIGHGKILTIVQREKRLMTTDPNCPKCLSLPETMDHVFRGCRFALKTLVFTASIWHCWKWRGNLIFNPGYEPPPNPHHTILQFSSKWLDANNVVNAKPIREVIQVHWSPTLGNFKLKVDGSSKTDSWKICADGLLRDSNGA